MDRINSEWSHFNPGPDELVVWLEPWAEEFVVPVLSTVALKASDEAETREVGEIEWASDHVVVWASAKTVRVFIDDVLQDSASSIVPIPDGMTKGMLNVLFADQPSARLGGAASYAVDQTSRWKRLWHLFRST